MAKINPATIMSEPRTLYMEGVKTKYASIAITAAAGGYSATSVTLPFDPRKAKAIRAIRPKTVGQTFFGNDMFMLSDGELVGKQYSVTPAGPSVTFTFNGIAGNLAFLKYAAIAEGQGGAVPALNVTMANAALFYELLGLSVGAVVGQNPGNLTDPAASVPSYLGSTINKNIIASVFEAGLKQSSGLDMAAAFREIAKKILYADANPDTGGSSGIFVRGGGTTQLATIDQRFRLIDSIAGATDQDLIKAFYGAGPGINDINPFVASILGENLTGEHSVMEVFRSLAERAYHSLTEMAAPPFLNGKLSRMMVTPRLFAADPPLCNVFLRRMTSGVTAGVTALKTTRLILSQHFPFSNNPPKAFLSIAPRELELAVIKGDSKSVKLFASTTQEESEVGVLAQSISNLYGSSVPLEASDDNNLLLKWFDKTNPLRFLDVRTEGQASVVQMEFNPFVAVGFPGVFFDPFLGAGRGLVKSVTHNITASSATTTVVMDHCIFSDAMEYTADSDDIETGFNEELPSYKNVTVSDVYEKALGCQSLMKAAQEFGFEGDTIAAVAESANEKFSATAQAASDKSAIYGLISRPIASYQDLLSFYGSDLGEVPDSPPNELDLGSKFYIDAQKGVTIQVDPLDGNEATTEQYVVDAVPTAGAIMGSSDVGATKYQVYDRVGAVKKYVSEVS